MGKIAIGTVDVAKWSWLNDQETSLGILHLTSPYTLLARLPGEQALSLETQFGSMVVAAVVVVAPIVPVVPVVPTMIMPVLCKLPAFAL